MDDLETLNTPGYDVSGDSETREEYGQGLFDFDLAWTFDFLDKNDVSHIDFSEAYNDAATVLPNNDDTGDWLNTALGGGVPQPRRHEKQPQPSILDETEVNQAIASSSDALSKATVVNDDLRKVLLELVTLDGRDVPSTINYPAQAFPDNRSLQYFMLLYIRLVHPRFPTIHIPTFSTIKTPPVVLLGMMLAGSCHSASNGDRFCCNYLDRCRYWLATARERDLRSVRILVFPAKLWLTSLPVG